ncbi:MAG TPA: hypothetical protein VFW90_04115 [Candidatus Saccharimonadales bacterium]|nr:hypothetical protein [Candidatus Saccharimonadales bacterium]
MIRKVFTKPVSLLVFIIVWLVSICLPISWGGVTPKAFAVPTVVFLTTGTTWQVPNDWNPYNNSIEVIGGGGGGANGASNQGGSGAGGAGGAYSKAVNVAMPAGNTVTVKVGVAGTAGGGAGGDTFVCNTNSGCSAITSGGVVAGAKGGTGGSAQTGGTGGQATGGVGSTKNNGGAGAGGGNGSGSSGAYGGGGGGAAGPSAAGNSGTAGTATSASVGGQGDGTSGGAGGMAATVNNAGGPGGDGTEWDSTHGAGGGGAGGGAGAGNGSNGADGGLAGNYGAGGGGGGSGGKHSSAGGSGSAGKQGLIVITYEPMVISISITTSGTITYGTLAGNTSKDTTASGLNQAQTVQNDGNVPEDFSIEGQNTTCPWTLSSTNGPNQYIHSFSTNSGGSWQALSTAYQTAASNVSTGSSQNLDFRLTTPTSTTCYTSQSVNITIQATVH